MKLPLQLVFKNFMRFSAPVTRFLRADERMQPHFRFISGRGDLEALGLAFFLKFIAPLTDTFFGNAILCGYTVDRSSFLQAEANNLLFKFRSVILWHNMHLFSLQNDYILLATTVTTLLYHNNHNT